MSTSSFNYRGLDLLLIAFPTYILVVANRTRCVCQKIYVGEEEDGEALREPNPIADGGPSEAVSG